MPIDDPTLMTDSTGDGMHGETDVRYSTQQELKRTMYNGSKTCKSCGFTMGPVAALYSELCASCTRRSASKRVKGRMV